MPWQPNWANSVFGWNLIHPVRHDTLMGNDLSMYQLLQDHPHYIHSFSPALLPTDSAIAPSTF